MSTHVSSRVKRMSRSRLADRLVLLCLADNANDDGFCWPSAETIAADANLSERQARQSLGNLEAAGEIAYIAGRGRGHLSVYVVLVGLNEDERAERTASLEAKADEIAAALRVRRERRKRSEKGQNSHLFGKEKGQTLHPLDDEKGQNSHLFGKEKGQNSSLKGADRIAALASPMPNDVLIHHGTMVGTYESCSTIPTPLPPEPEPVVGRSDAGEDSSIGQLRRVGVLTADGYHDIPPHITSAAIDQARRHPKASDPDRLARLVVGLLRRYRAGTWSPPEPQEDRDATPDRPARRARSAGRTPAANRPAGSGPPPGVRVPTAEDLAEWGIGPGRPWPEQPT